jgi:uncharacterized protein (TIGR02145 family)
MKKTLLLVVIAVLLLQVINLNAQTSVQVVKPLPAGWSWFSVNVLSGDMSIGAVLASISPNEGDYIKNQTVSATYYKNGGWFGELTTIDPREMYKIRLSKADTMVFAGEPVEPSITPITITIQPGWNWIGYTPSILVRANDALGSLGNQEGDYIKNQTSSSMYYSEYGWFGVLDKMKPLDGFMLKSALGGTLTYPTPKAGYLIDPRDGKQYQWVKFGTQTWMIDNMAYLPSVSPSNLGSQTDPYYYVYGYEGSSVSEAKAKPNYATYGVLYNWKAATTACPFGWHLPTDSDWTGLTGYLTINGYGYQDSGSDTGKSMAKDSGWQNNSFPSMVGNEQETNNSSGFAASPGGYRYQNGFGNMSSDCWMWTADPLYARFLLSRLNALGATNSDTRFGFSVRCVKD